MTKEQKKNYKTCKIQKKVQEIMQNTKKKNHKIIQKSKKKKKITKLRKLQKQSM